MEELLKVTPTSALTFSITLGKKTSTHLSLVNISPHTVAYKVKTTHIKRYCVRPNSALLRPDEKVDVEIEQQVARTVPSDLHDCRDRFLLLAVALPNVTGLSDNPNVSEVWGKAAEADSATVCRTKFSVQIELVDASADVKAPSPMVTETESPLEPCTEAEEKHAQDVQDVTKDSPSSSVQSPPPSEDRRARSVTSRSSAKSSESPPPVSKPSLETPSIPDSPSGLSSSISPATKNSSTARSVPVTTPLAATSATSTTSTASPIEDGDAKYKSVAFARSRALGIRPAPRVEPPVLDSATRQRIAVERAGELVRVINARQKDLDTIRRELAEARHKLSDAQMATRPAYNVRYEVNEGARVPFAQICIMAIISGALLQLLV